MEPMRNVGLLGSIMSAEYDPVLIQHIHESAPKASLAGSTFPQKRKMRTIESPKLHRFFSSIIITLFYVYFFGWVA